MTTSLPSFEYDIIGLSNASRRTISSHIMAHAFAKCSGVQLDLARPVWPLKKRAQVLTLKIPAQSGGMVIVTRQMLCSMNFEDVSRWSTSSGGSTVIHTIWKSKEAPSPPMSDDSGSLLTYRHLSGSPVMEELPSIQELSQR